MAISTELLDIVAQEVNSKEVTFLEISDAIEALTRLIPSESDQAYVSTVYAKQIKDLAKYGRALGELEDDLDADAGASDGSYEHE